MKRFNIFILISIIFFIPIIIGLINSHQPQIVFEPKSDKNNFYQNLNLAINTAKISTSTLNVMDFNNQVEFYLSQDNQNIKIILSDQKDPFGQISSLQDIIKTARINHQSLKLVDLSPAHPYATFKNN
ncbi:MAG: hypothetical protein KIH89_003725 [Candidatus Shapirobacteria bacterium]|nr:hypothetical protein [Candidatus Shapirobacteria bacterium]